MWQPKEIIVHQLVKNDPITKYFLSQCPTVPVRNVNSGRAEDIVKASQILQQSGNRMLDKIIAGKQVVFISPPGNVVDTFTMPDDRMMCPHFERLKLAANGCYYQCDWCYLKLTYRAAFPFITIKVGYDKIKRQIKNRFEKSSPPIIFNSGELADSLALDHLTRVGREFIPWFGQTDKGYLFMLTKSDNVEGILDLDHNGRTIIAWSMNNETVSRKFEIGAPSFERRLLAAQKVQKAGYPVRIRLDPIVPLNGWQAAYSATISRVFEKINPERITIGTLRFEQGFYNMRHSIFTSGSELPDIVGQMQPMFKPKHFPGSKTAKSGKYSFTAEKRTEIFNFIIDNIQKYSNAPIALCKESAEVWQQVGLDLSKCSCVCQLDSVDMQKDAF